MLLTLGRVAAIPLVLLLFFLPIEHARQYATILYAGACITDWFDGWLARRWNQMTKFGAFLDPVADKLMVAVCLVMLLYAHGGDAPTPVATPGSAVLAVLVAVIVGREITVSALREWMAELGSRANVAVNWIGKLKTVFQMTSIGMMIWQIETFGIPWYTVGFWLLFIAAALTLWSMVMYLRAAWPMMRDA
jgi:CDP-diacylglycerol--glycerol-3-phosphate 3-phosphatidyltransferase